METKSFIVLALISVLVTLGDGLKLRKLDGTFFMSKRLREQYKALIIQDRDDDVITAWTAGEVQEGHNVSQVTHACPWKYVMVTNENRIPQSHLEAQCMTHQCLNFTKNEFIPNGRPLDHENNVSFIESFCCSKVLLGKWVKARSMTPKGVPKYDRRILMVAASCSCNHQLVTFCDGLILRKLRHVDGSFFMSEQLREQYKDLIIPDSDDDVITSWTAGQGQEDTKMSKVTHACPWTYVMVTNKNRIPQSHLEAQCMTYQCLNFTKNEFIPNGRPFDQENFFSFIQSSRCTKVFFGKWIKVRSITPYGFPKYDKRILMVASACSCNHKCEMILK